MKLFPSVWWCGSPWWIVCNCSCVRQTAQQVILNHSLQCECYGLVRPPYASTSTPTVRLRFGGNGLQKWRRKERKLHSFHSTSWVDPLHVTDVGCVIRLSVNDIFHHEILIGAESGICFALVLEVIQFRLSCYNFQVLYILRHINFCYSTHIGRRRFDTALLWQKSDSSTNLVMCMCVCVQMQ